MSVTVKDVAKAAGVATSTVSRVINDHSSISNSTKKKVRKVMDELGYVPNTAARNLGKKTAGAIGLIFPPGGDRIRLENPFFIEVLQTVNAEATKQELIVSVATAGSYKQLVENVRMMYQRKQVDGFILLYSTDNDPVIDYLKENQVPFTLIGQPYKDEDKVVYIDNDNQLVGKQATNFLIENHHQNILFVTNTTNENIYFERFFGYQKAMMLAGLSPLPAATFQKPEDFLALQETLSANKVTALVVIDDLFALRIMQLCKMYGYEVPEDLSIITFNNSLFSTLTHPYLTSIDIKVEELARLSTTKLIEQITKQEAMPGVRLLVSHELIQRETVQTLL